MNRIVGIDLDNTIITYDALIADIAAERGWLPELTGTEGKKTLRDRLLVLPDGNAKWTLLQAIAYGSRIDEAQLAPGVLELFSRCRAASVEVHVISHKTRTAAANPRIDLRAAALEWMERRGLFGSVTGLSKAHVHFEDSRRAKIQRISAVGCTVYIDDLEETFADPAFPESVERILLAPPTATTRGDVIAFPDLHAVAIHLFGPPGVEWIAQQVSRVLGRMPNEIRTMAAGRNNRLFLVVMDERRYVAKHYLTRRPGEWDRMRVEYEGLRLLRSAGITDVPRPVARDHAAALALYEYVDGEVVGIDDVREADISRVARFVEALRNAGAARGADRVNVAAEACFSVQETVRSVEHRLDLLSGARRANAELDAFLGDELAPALALATDRAYGAARSAGMAADEPTPAEHRVLNPSDFGFHNTLRRPDGGLTFLDFEYFGWDDATKMISDFMLQPVVALGPSAQRRAMHEISATFRRPELLRERVRAVYPLFAVKWALIYLNEFLPQRRMRRWAVDPGFDLARAQGEQLGKARATLRRVLSGDATSISVDV